MLLRRHGLIDVLLEVGRLKGTYELHQRALFHRMSPGQDLRDTRLGNTQAQCELGLGATAHRIRESSDLGGADRVVVVWGAGQARAGL
jgi:hypothetical protein